MRNKSVALKASCSMCSHLLEQEWQDGNNSNAVIVNVLLSVSRDFLGSLESARRFESVMWLEVAV